jgi:hypothetical protein
MTEIPGQMSFDELVIDEAIEEFLNDESPWLQMYPGPVPAPGEQSLGWR